jgi:hypothetical protein
VSSVLAYLCLTRFFLLLCSVTRKRSPASFYFARTAAAGICYFFFNDWMDGWMDWRERNHIGKTGGFGVFCDSLLLFPVWKEGLGDSFIWEIELVC